MTEAVLEGGISETSENLGRSARLSGVQKGVLDQEEWEETRESESAYALKNMAEIGQSS